MKINNVKNFIFSITNKDNQKVITVLGVKIKLKNNFISIEDKLCKIDNNLQNLSNEIPVVSQSFDTLCQEYYSKAEILTQNLESQIKAVQEELTNLKKFSESNFQEIKYHLYMISYIITGLADQTMPETKYGRIK